VNSDHPTTEPDLDDEGHAAPPTFATEIVRAAKRKYEAEHTEQAPARDEDAQRTTRRDALRNLLARLERGAMLAEEKALLRQHVETEIREHDTARAVALGNKRHVQTIVPEIDRLAAELEQAKTAVAELAQAIRLTREYVGEELLPPVEGWSWYDALRRHAPHELTTVDGTEQPTTTEQP
jgi:hypothetical protein